eukprot:GFYU01000996.1.p1 GENE.GFYU01000996.1~~GFYU01000996.1.p1  ORF type:complete len:218 (+),score=46.29 GFYU01000996.1:187-840(+)
MIGFFFSRLTSNVVGLLYPAYSSFKALKSGDVELLRKWCMYWIIMAAFTVFEFYADILISWLPFYYEAKLAFVLWLVYPDCRGSGVLYEHYVHPLLDQHEEDIDSAIEDAKTRAQQRAVEWSRHGMAFVAERGVEYFAKFQQYIAQMAANRNTITDGTTQGHAPPSARVQSMPPPAAAPRAATRPMSMPPPSAPNLEEDEWESLGESNTNGLRQRRP